MNPKKYWQYVIAGLDASRYAIHRQLPPSRSHHLLLACMPKSGSTYLTAILASLPGFKTVSLVLGGGRREQELDICMLLLNHRMSYAAQNHVRFSEPTAKLLRRFDIKPIVLVRNIFDVVVSLRDHIRNESESVEWPMGYVFPYMKGWDDAELEEFIVYMFIPWYFNFYLSWMDYEPKRLVSYEDLAVNPLAVITKINSQFALGFTTLDLEHAIASVSTSFTRKNKAIVGRGHELDNSIKEHIYKMASFYKGVDLSPIGIDGC